jgi:hypothetical protein
MTALSAGANTAVKMPDPSHRLNRTFVTSQPLFVTASIRKLQRAD